MQKVIIFLGLIAVATAFRGVQDDGADDDDGNTGEQGSCEAQPEPVCFDEGVRDNEGACTRAEGCVWDEGGEGGGTTGDDEGPSLNDDLVGGNGAQCMVESCTNQETESACGSFSSRNGECEWADDRCDVSGALDGLGSGGLGSGAGDIDDIAVGDDDGGTPNGMGTGGEGEENPCMENGMDENGCNGIDGCVWEEFSTGVIEDDGDDAGGPDTGIDLGSCSQESCYSQASRNDCSAYTASGAGNCTWDSEYEFCSSAGEGPPGGPGDGGLNDDLGGGSGASDDVPTLGDDDGGFVDGMGSGMGGGGGVDNPCFSNDVMSNEDACNALDACEWQTFESPGGVEDDGDEAGSPDTGMDMGNCAEISCYTQSTESACTAFSEDCAWDAEFSQCNSNDIGTPDGTLNDDLGGSGGASDDVPTINDDIVDGDDTNGMGGQEQSPCFAESVMEDEQACNRIDGCLWETFEGPDGESDLSMGSCSEESCYSQTSEDACTGFGDTCEWTDNQCTDSEGAGGTPLDDDLGGGSGGGSGLNDDPDTGLDTATDCTDFANNRNRCEGRGCVFTGVTTVATTTRRPPTSPPTSPPTNPPPPPTNNDGSCPRNCGTEANGGGTCRDNGRCLSCNANRVIQGGRCYASIACKGRRIQSGSQTGSTCRCLDDNCHYCNRGPDGDTCRVCRDGTYLLDGGCVESCPTGMTMLGIGAFKRRCMAPFECQNGRIQGMDVGYGCKCANDDMTPSACQFCSFRANEFGQHCTRCLGGQYLQADNRCHANCDGTGMISYAPGNYGRECRAPFTCTDRTDQPNGDGFPCKCARSVGRNDCASCDYGIGGVTCSRCTNSMYLENGACVEECASGSPSGSGDDGRECN